MTRFHLIQKWISIRIIQSIICLKFAKLHLTNLPFYNYNPNRNNVRPSAIQRSTREDIEQSSGDIWNNAHMLSFPPLLSCHIHEKVVLYCYKIIAKSRITHFLCFCLPETYVMLVCATNQFKITQFCLCQPCMF